MADVFNILTIAVTAGFLLFWVLFKRPALDEGDSVVQTARVAMFAGLILSASGFLLFADPSPEVTFFLNSVRILALLLLFMPGIVPDRRDPESR